MKRLLPCIALVLLFACKSKQPADLLVLDGNIYTVDSSFSIVEAMAIKDGKIIATGTSAQIREQYDAKDTVNAKGQFIYPGFIDAHAHFFGYARTLRTVDLVGTNSWDEIVDKVKAFAAQNREGWLIGRGWDQNDWPVKEFPSKEKLDELFPDRPVILIRIDGHAAIANQAALDLAAVKPGQTIAGGDIEVKNGKLTGILVDNATGLISSKIPSASTADTKKGLLDAQNNCFAVGLTTVDDCGLGFEDVQLIDSIQKSGELKMRIYAMLSDAPRNFDFIKRNGKIKTDRLNVRAFKVYADGALGSRGACLLKPYSDRPGWMGFLLSSKEHFDSVANVLFSQDLQMCTHAIGDSGNRVILNTYAKYLKGKNDRRWRIEHAQVVNLNDFNLFGMYSVIPSVQPTHATSDMYWAGDRLGKEREKGAYAFNDLMKQIGWIALGTDFPVEDISPFKTFYAAVVRKDAKGWPENGYQIENALSREHALRGMTIWAARSNFEENEKGSIQAGKFADFIMLDQDLMKAPDSSLLHINVLKTFVNGEKVYEKK